MVRDFSHYMPAEVIEQWLEGRRFSPSSSRADSAYLPESLSPSIPIIHHSWQVF